MLSVSMLGLEEMTMSTKVDEALQGMDRVVLALANGPTEELVPMPGTDGDRSNLCNQTKNPMKCNVYSTPFSCHCNEKEFKNLHKMTLIHLKNGVP